MKHSNFESQNLRMGHLITWYIIYKGSWKQHLLQQQWLLLHSLHFNIHPVLGVCSTEFQLDWIVLNFHSENYRSIMGES